VGMGWEREEDCGECEGEAQHWAMIAKVASAFCSNWTICLCLSN